MGYGRSGRWLLVALAAAPAAMVMSPASGAPGDITRVSVATSGEQPNDYSTSPAISADGRFVAFWSRAFNLVPGDTNAFDDIFLRDRQAGTTERVSVATGGGQANQYSTSPAISADGRFVAFISQASDLVVGDNFQPDIFLRDRQAGTTVREPGTDGAGLGGALAMTPDARFLAFTRGAGVFVRDRQSATTAEASVTPTGTPGNGASNGPVISNDGRYVAFQSTSTDLVAGDTNGTTDVFVRDLQAGVTVRASVAGAAAQGNGTSTNAAMSGDGRLVFFVSSSTDLVAGDTNAVTDVFVRDVQAATTTREAGTDGVLSPPAFSTSEALTVTPDGRLLGLVRSGGGSIVRDRQAGANALVASLPGNGYGSGLDLDISDDGRFVGFASGVDGLVPGDTNRTFDIFVQELGASAPPGGGSPTAQQSTTLTVTGAAPGTLSITVAQAGVAFAGLTPGATTAPTPVGTITYANTSPTGAPWSATVAASNMTSGPNTVACTNVAFAPGSLAPPLTAGPPGSFAGPVVGGFCGARTLMTGGSADRGTFTHAGSTATVALPAATPPGSYVGTLQYTVLG